MDWNGNDWGGPFGGSWGFGRRRSALSFDQLVALFFVVGLYGFCVQIYRKLVALSELEQHLLIALGVLGVVGFVLWRVVRAYLVQPGVAEPSSDVVGLRFAVDATVAPRLAAALTEALKLPRSLRLARVAESLLDAKQQWRLVGLSTTPPLPASQAAALFDRWVASVRERFVREAPPEGGDPFREQALLVVCLHLETYEEIPDLRDDDPESVSRTLYLLRGKPRTVRRVDLWSSARPVSAKRLLELDPKMLPV